MHVERTLHPYDFNIKSYALYLCVHVVDNARLKSEKKGPSRDDEYEEISRAHAEINWARDELTSVASKKGRRETI